MTTSFFANFILLDIFIFQLYNKQIDKELYSIVSMGKCHVFLPPML